MSAIKKIMVVLAFGEYSEGVFRYAAQLAQSLEADLIVANVINARDVDAIAKITAMGYQIDGEHYVRDIQAERQQILDRLTGAAHFPADRLTTVFKVGNPVDVLLKLTLDRNVDMVVMGLKGRSNIEHVFIGSVAERVFRRSPVTVVSYREPELAAKLKKRIHDH